jgi:hypothetical protein
MAGTDGLMAGTDGSSASTPLAVASGRLQHKLEDVRKSLATDRARAMSAIEEINVERLPSARRVEDLEAVLETAQRRIVALEKSERYTYSRQRAARRRE